MIRPVVIIGGGITGVIAAQTLQNNGINVLIIDKSNSVGGRMATRRIGNGKVDHGAQFFTVRTKLFQTYVEEWQKKGWVRIWFGDRHSRYKGTEGMNSLVKNIASSIPVKLNTKINKIELVDDYYIVTTQENIKLTANGVILTPPVPQTLEMLKYIQLESNLRKQLEGITYNPCLVLLLSFERDSKIPSPGYLSYNLPEGIERIVDHKKKDISTTTTISVYSTGSWARQHYELPNEEICELLLEKMKHYIYEDQLKSVQLKRWKYSEAVSILSSPYVDLGQSVPLFVAGDAFLQKDDPSKRTRIESAVLSGISVGKEMVKRFT